MTIEIIKRRGGSMMGNMVAIMFLIGLVMFTGKGTALGQNTDVQCLVVGQDSNFKSDDPRYFINFGSFSVSEKGKQVKITRHYKVPRINQILNVLVYFQEEGQAITQVMMLSKKRVSRFSDFDDEKLMRDVISHVSMVYPVEDLDETEGGGLSIQFLGKKKPVRFAMMCRKAGTIVFR